MSSNDSAGAINAICAGCFLKAKDLMSLFRKATRLSQKDFTVNRPIDASTDVLVRAANSPIR